MDGDGNYSFVHIFLWLCSLVPGVNIIYQSTEQHPQGLYELLCSQIEILLVRDSIC